MADKTRSNKPKSPTKNGGTAKKNDHVIERLHETILSRRRADPATSRTARLFQRGTAKIAQKVGEEAVEAVIEGIRGKRKRLIEESADLLYHLLVLWADRGIAPREVWAELERRGGPKRPAKKDPFA